MASRRKDAMRFLMKMRTSSSDSERSGKEGEETAPMEINE
jgi:hypothetical protein